VTAPGASGRAFPWVASCALGAVLAQLALVLVLLDRGWWPAGAVSLLVVLAALGFRRHWLVGAALAWCAGLWVAAEIAGGRNTVTGDVPAGLDEGAGGRALLAAMAVFAVTELARLAIDAGPRRGPVRVEPAVLRSALAGAGVAGAVGGASAAVIVVALGSGSMPPWWGVLGIVGLPSLMVGVSSAGSKLAGTGRRVR